MGTGGEGSQGLGTRAGAGGEGGGGQVKGSQGMVSWSAAERESILWDCV